MTRLARWCAALAFACAATLAAAADVRYVPHVTNPHLQRLLAHNGTLWAVGTDGAVWRSRDGGAQWHDSPSATPHTLRAVTRTSDGRLIAVGEQGSVVVSDEAGQRWQSRDVPSVQDLIAVAADDTGRRVVAAGMGGALLVSTNGGDEWASVPTPHAKGIGLVAYLPRQRHFIALGEHGHLSIANDTLEWRHRRLPQVQTFTALAVDAQGTAWAGSSHGAVLRSTDGGFTWQRREIGVKDYIAQLWVASDGRSVVALGNRGLLAHSGDGGTRWRVQRAAGTPHPVGHHPAPHHAVARGRR